MRSAFATLVLASSLVLVLGACGSGSTTKSAAPALTGASTPSPTLSPSVNSTPSATPNASETVDNHAVGMAMAKSVEMDRVILANVWAKTPQAKRKGTCGRWASTPEDLYTIPLFAAMDRAVVTEYFDKACAAL